MNAGCEQQGEEEKENEEDEGDDEEEEEEEEKEMRFEKKRTRRKLSKEKGHKVGMGYNVIKRRSVKLGGARIKRVREKEDHDEDDRKPKTRRSM